MTISVSDKARLLEGVDAFRRDLESIPIHDSDPAPVPIPDPPPPIPDPIPGGMSAGHWLFGELQSEAQLRSYGLPKALYAGTIYRGHRPGYIDALVWHPHYHPRHTRDVPTIHAFIAAGASKWREWVVDELVSEAVALGATYAGVDWEGGGTLCSTAMLPTLEILADELRAHGIRVLHWPKLAFEHQIRHGGHDVEWWSGWCRDHVDGIGWWDPSATASMYEQTANRVEDYGFAGDQWAIAYPLKGVSHAEDVRIIQRPWGGIFNPKSQYDLTSTARQVWA